MYTTTHYSLNIVEGTDVVNPLVQQNPNFETIDTAMYANKQASVGTGTELTAGSVHTITRANPDSNYVRFTATSNWTAGDSMIVDSTPVTVYLSDGKTPATGAYVINTEVLILVNGSRVTLLTSGKQNAEQVSYDNNDSGMNATDVQEAIDENHANILTRARVIEHRKVDGTNTTTFTIPPADRGVFMIVNRTGILIVSEASDGSVERCEPLGSITYTDLGSNKIEVSNGSYYRGVSLISLN